MPTLYVRDVPERLVEALKRDAARDQRSVSAQVVHVLEVYAHAWPAVDERRAAAARIAQARARTAAAPEMPDSLALLREDRDR